MLTAGPDRIGAVANAIGEGIGVHRPWCAAVLGFARTRSARSSMMARFAGWFTGSGSPIRSVLRPDRGHAAPTPAVARSSQGAWMGRGDVEHFVDFGNRRTGIHQVGFLVGAMTGHFHDHFDLSNRFC